MGTDDDPADEPGTPPRRGPIAWPTDAIGAIGEALDASASRLGKIDTWWQTTAARTRRFFTPERPEMHPTRLRRAWLLVVFTVRRWLAEDRGAGMAAVLTIQTLLSTVPLIAVALLIVGLMDPTSGASLLENLAGAVVPEGQRSRAMAAGALELARNVTVSNLGWWGFAVVMGIAFALFSTLERTLNRIWRVSRKRHLLVKFTMFYTLATLGPVLILYSLAQPFVAGVTQAISLPVLTTTLGLVLLNRFIPFTEVRWRPAMVGGLVSAVLIELSKLGFGYYATRFALQTYEGVYGSLAMLPILVIWSYLSWMVILLGAELSVVIQRRKLIALQGYINRYVLDRTEMQSDSGRTAARLLLAICDRYARYGASTHPERLGLRFRMPVDRIVEILDELERQGWLLEAEGEGQNVIPARPLEQLRVADVLLAFDRETTSLPRDDELGRLFAELDRARDGLLDDVTFADLVSVHRAPPLSHDRNVDVEQDEEQDQAARPDADSSSMSASVATIARLKDH